MNSTLKEVMKCEEDGGLGDDLKSSAGVVAFQRKRFDISWSEKLELSTKHRVRYMRVKKRVIYSAQNRNRTL